MKLNTPSKGREAINKRLLLNIPKLNRKESKKQN